MYRIVILQAAKRINLIVLEMSEVEEHVPSGSSDEIREGNVAEHVVKDEGNLIINESISKEEAKEEVEAQDEEEEKEEVEEEEEEEEDDNWSDSSSSSEVCVRSKLYNWYIYVCRTCM